MRYKAIQQLQTVILVFGVITLLGIGLLVARNRGYTPALLSQFSSIGSGQQQADKQIVLISGHAGFDSGAICTDEDGEVSLTEAALNASIAEHLAHRLRAAQFTVTIFEEYDVRLQNLQASLLLSLHSDSCIDRSGYKAARHPNSSVGKIEDILLTCLERHYSTTTNLPYHPNTLTHDMFEYHAFTKVAPQTPAIILEMGFMGGDQRLLAQEESLVARGIAESIDCFFEEQLSTPIPSSS